MTLAYVTTPFIGLVDTAVVGQLGSAALIGGLAAGAIVFDVVFSTFNSLRSATTGLIAQAFGRGDELEQRLVFVLAALQANWEYFIRYVGMVVGVVFVHNASALATGYGLGFVSGLPEPDRRAVSIECGIQNSGLGLILIFNFFDGLGGMAVVAAWWGIWHIVAGLSLATFWSRRPPVPQSVATSGKSAYAGKE